VIAPYRADAGSDGVGKSKFCLIIPPEIKKAADTKGGGLVRAIGPMTAATSASDGKIVSFFNGKMEKLGVGTPDCFRISPMDQPGSVTEAQMLSSDPVGYSEALDGEFELRSFFPSVGYFNRASSDGTSAVAVGIGLKGPSGTLGGVPEGNPSAGVSLMFGFGF
jgi:hypothetical protein